MWNFFILFFYEASLEISMSIAVGYPYLWEADDKGTPSNAVTRRAHRVMIIGFFALQVIVYVVIVAIMTRSVKKMEEIEASVGGLYDFLDY